VDEAEAPANVPGPGGEVVRPHMVADPINLWGRDDDRKRFTVLMKDGRVLTVRGHGLKHTPHAVAGQDVYSVVIRSAGEEVVVALFKNADVAGIFCGELCADRKIA